MQKAAAVDIRHNGRVKLLDELSEVRRKEMVTVERNAGGHGLPAAGSEREPARRDPLQRRQGPHRARFGLLRFVRDLFHIPGRIELDAQGHVLQITLRSSQPYAEAFARALVVDGLSLILGQI